MTTMADQIWIKAGINADELEAMKGRTALYIGMAGLLTVSLMFAGMTLANVVERLF